MRYEKYISRAMVRDEPKSLFVFGDNMARVGRGGQAKEMRGEPNAIGIPTKWRPTMYPGDLFKDGDFLPDVKREIDLSFGRLFMHAATGGEIVWPVDGIGTGLAYLYASAPMIWEYIEAGRKALHRMSDLE